MPNFDLVAHNMAIDRIEVDRLDKFLYFRGWDVFFEFCIFLYTYIKEKYFGIVSLIIIISMLTDFISDLFNIYFSVIGHPSPLLTIIITIRLLAIYCVILNLKYSQNLPNKNDKFNILLSFKSV